MRDSSNVVAMRLITIGNSEREAHDYRKPAARGSELSGGDKAITDISEVAQRAKGRNLSNNNNYLPTNTSTFEAAIHSI